MTYRSLAKLAAVAGVIALGFLLPFATLGTANLALVNALVAVSLVVLTGWVGQISLAQAAFVGIGSFTTSLVVRDFGFGFPLTVLVGALVAMVAAAALGLVALRVRGLYLAVATLIFAWMAQGYLFNLPEFVGTGGSSLANTPPLGEEGTIPYLDFTNRRTFYYVLLAAVGASTLAMANLRDSKTGRAFFAVKGSEVAAASLGIDVTRTKLAAFAVSGFLAGLAGSLLMTHESTASVTQFTVERSLLYLSIAVVGGLTSLGGALASGTLFASLEELFFRVEALAGFLLLVSAGLLAGVLLFFPAGLAGIPARVSAVAQRLGAIAFVRRAADTYRSLRQHQADREPGEADDAFEGTSDEPSEPRNGGDATEEDADEARVGDETVVADEASWWDRVPEPLARLSGRLRARFPRLRRRSPRGSAPDALLTSLADEEARLEAARAATEAESAKLVYTPGTAKKLRLPARAKRSPILQASNVTVRFGGLTAVNDFDLEVREGEITALIGPNGAGKTTCFNAISGLNQPTSGQVHLWGHDVSDLPVHARAQLGMGRTFQVLQLFPELSVFENLMVATHLRNPTGFFSHVATTSTAVGWEVAARERVHQVVELMGLEDEADLAVAGLPFGRLRLVELARALVTGSPFVMLDEPASGLDNTETDRFMDLLLWVRQHLGVTMLLIEHDMRVVMGLADYAYVIDRGNKIAEGTTKQIQKNKAVIAAYLGTATTDDDADSGEPGDAQPVAAPGDGKGRSRPARKTKARARR